MLRKIFFAGVTLLSGVAAAERPHPVQHADGSIQVGGHVYASTHAWLTSPEFQAAGGRCGTPAPQMPLVMAPVAVGFPDCSDSATIINPAYIDGRAFVIQVVFHLIQKTDGTGNITDDQVKSQIQVLNDDYLAAAGSHGAPGHNAGIKFVLARFDPTGNPTSGIERVTNNSYFSEGDAGTSAMKTALHWDTSRYLNVYSSGLDSVGLLGYATFPWDRIKNASTMAIDGVVLTYQSVGVNPAYVPYDLGASATHEIGHWFGLYHPFQDGCVGIGATAYTAGDLISDTPRDQTSHSGCTPTPSECGDAGKFDPIENYMEYTDDSCMTTFTLEQINRARCGVVHYRNINTEPTSLFTFTSAALVTTFTNASTDVESQPAQMHYNWDFGDGMTGTDQSPVHTYATAGTYTVTLEVVDPGSAASTSTQMVVVASTGGNGSGSATGSGSGNGGGDAGLGGGDDDDGNGGSSSGGCCSANGGDLSFLLSGAPIAFVLLRRRRR